MPDGRYFQPRWQLPAHHSLLEDEGDGGDGLAAAAEEHLADGRVGVGLGPRLEDQETGATLGLLDGDIVEPEADRRRDPLAVAADRRQPITQLTELLVGDQVAAGQDQVRLAPEVRVDRAGRRTRGTDDVLHRA